MSTNASFSPPSLVMATIGLSLATFMQVLDTTIANVALPTISGNLGVSSEQGTWVITSFAVSNAIALPLTGWLSRRFGEVKLFLWATMLFVLASFLCGISTSMPELVGFRVLQGLVAGPLYPMTQTLLIAVYPPAKRGMALALLAMVTVVAPIAGPIPGGWITDTPGVRSFGLSHVTTDTILAAFDDLAALVADCPRGCQHDSTAPECALDEAGARGDLRPERLESFRRMEKVWTSPPAWD